MATWWEIMSPTSILSASSSLGLAARLSRLEQLCGPSGYPFVIGPLQALAGVAHPRSPRREQPLHTADLALPGEGDIIARLSTSGESVLTRIRAI